MTAPRVTDTEARDVADSRYYSSDGQVPREILLALDLLSARQRIAALEAALRRYGDHLGWAPEDVSDACVGGDDGCTCGYSAALDDKEPQ